MSVYEFNPDMAPDSEFEAGELAHLVEGNAGRLLDPRRTPITIVEIRPASGMFIVRLDDFEDRGAEWEMPLEDVSKFQFARRSARASAHDVEALDAAIVRLSAPLSIECDSAREAQTRHLIDQARDEASDWLGEHSSFLASGAALTDPHQRRADPRLCDDLREFLSARGLWSIEDALARQYVRNPHSGEMIKGHRIVIAELGLAPFEGKAPRDPDIFEGEWRRERRAEHIIARLGFIRAVFARLGLDRITLFRGISSMSPIESRSGSTFISATFSREIAESHYEAAGSESIGMLLRQPVPIERLFMTYHETGAMNEHYREAEAVLLCDQGNALF